MLKRGLKFQKLFINCVLVQTSLNQNTKKSIPSRGMRFVKFKFAGSNLVLSVQYSIF